MCTNKECCCQVKEEKQEAVNRLVEAVTNYLVLSGWKLRNSSRGEWIYEGNDAELRGELRGRHYLYTWEAINCQRRRDSRLFDVSPFCKVC